MGIIISDTCCIIPFESEGSTVYFPSCYPTDDDMDSLPHVLQVAPMGSIGTHHAWQENEQHLPTRCIYPKGTAVWASWHQLPPPPLLVWNGLCCSLSLWGHSTTPDIAHYIECEHWPRLPCACDQRWDHHCGAPQHPLTLPIHSWTHHKNLEYGEFITLSCH